MGKHRGHQDKSRRAREKKMPRQKAKANRDQVNGVKGTDGGKSKGRHVVYAAHHSVLVCGDGDFSFTRGIIKHRGSGKGVVATSLDSRKTVLNKYPRAETWLSKLHSDGAQVVHSVDATRLGKTVLGSMQKGGETKDKSVLFDRVVFNFPHTGVQRTHLNRNLLRDFFASSTGLVKCAADGGEVHVTLKTKPPYTGWNVKAMAKDSGLVMVRCLTFDPREFPGYRHSTTDPKAKEFDATGAITHVFARARSDIDDEVDTSGAFPVLMAATKGGMPRKAAGKDGLTKGEDCDEALPTKGKVRENVRSGGDMSDEENVDTVTEAPEIADNDSDPVEAATSIERDDEGVIMEGDSKYTKDNEAGRLSEKSGKRRLHSHRFDHSAGTEQRKPARRNKTKQIGKASIETVHDESKVVSAKPPLIKKKAAKRRAARIRAAERARAGAAIATSVDDVSSAEDVLEKQEGGVVRGERANPQGDTTKSSKRRRGKYVRNKEDQGHQATGLVSKKIRHQ